MSEAGATNKCKTFVVGYRHDDATKAEAQAYARCIGRLYPEKNHVDPIASAVIVVISILVCIVAGAHRKSLITGVASGLVFALFAKLIYSTIN